MITTHTKYGVIKTLLELEDSTTLFIESFNGIKLNVEILSQCEKTEHNSCFIERVTLLFFHSPQHPVLYCTSYLNKNELTAEEYTLLVDKELPLGKLFMQLNDAASIRKANISTKLETDPLAVDRLNVKSPWLYRKEYDYWIGERKLGQIVEFFNEESLMRI